jgi:hypothetical protein
MKFRKGGTLFDSFDKLSIICQVAVSHILQQTTADKTVNIAVFYSCAMDILLVGD